MMKKKYRKPEVVTRKIEFGVFGDYTDCTGGEQTTQPAPLAIIRYMDLHME